MDETSMPASRERWKILRDAILKKKLIVNSSQSVRSFDSFKLFLKKRFDCSSKPNVYDRQESECDWFSYTCKDIIESKPVWIQHPSMKTDLKEVTSFNNTGNVCIWPSEEVLAYYCTLHRNKFAQKSVVELGAGSSALAGMSIAINAQSPGDVVLTDGNAKCVESIEATIEMNKDQINAGRVSAALLRWDDEHSYENYVGKFDYVVCADCLFFDQTRELLSKTIFKLLKHDGVALIFAPQRGKTLVQFLDICEEQFTFVSTSEHYCEQVTNCHKHELKHNNLYKQDVHFPILIELHK